MSEEREPRADSEEWRAHAERVRDRVLDVVEAELERQLAGGAEELGAAADGLDWDPEAFETALGSWTQGPGRLLELSRRVREPGALEPVPLRRALDDATCGAATRLQRPQEIRRRALGREQSLEPVPGFLALLWEEILVEVADSVPSGSQLELGAHDGTVLLRARAEPDPVPDLSEAPLTKLLLAELGCASSRTGRDTWDLAWDRPVRGSS